MTVVELEDFSRGEAKRRWAELLRLVNELVPQGQGPVILRDKGLTTASLADALFGVGDSHTIPGTGITVTVQAGTGGAAYNIQLAYTPPVTAYNMRITRGDTVNGNFYGYFSPDIWVDSPSLQPHQPL